MWHLFGWQQYKSNGSSFWPQDPRGCGQGQVEHHGARGEGVHQGQFDEIDGEWNWTHY